MVVFSLVSLGSYTDIAVLDEGRKSTFKGVKEHDNDPKFKNGEPEINISSHISLRTSHKGSSNGNSVGGVFR